jgi:hypothetical protein
MPPMETAAPCKSTRATFQLQASKLARWPSTAELRQREMALASWSVLALAIAPGS